jgi:hypothetical protein
MYTVEKRVGRLVEARFGSPLTRADVESAVQLVQAIGAASPGQMVACTDVSGLDIVPPEAVDLITALFTRTNPRVVRGAFLLPSAYGTVSIQMEHMIRQAGLANRRCFREPALLRRWLDDVLTSQEAARLAQFLAARAAPSETSTWYEGPTRIRQRV